MHFLVLEIFHPKVNVLEEFHFNTKLKFHEAKLLHVWLYPLSLLLSMYQAFTITSLIFDIGFDDFMRYFDNFITKCMIYVVIEMCRLMWHKQRATLGACCSHFSHEFWGLSGFKTGVNGVDGDIENLFSSLFQNHAPRWQNKSHS